MQTTAQLFKALSEEVRLRIMALLIEGELCVCDLMVVLDMPQSTISRHLAYLRNGGLVTGERRGVWMYYRLADGKNELAKDLLRVLSDHLLLLTVIRQDRKTLARYLAEKKSDSCR
ncbi:MAG TPA: metalloregulator ArsR/SmtB family transcription factor [Desulfobulbus sp.]|nr:metalloregulator ArsR/SmtB family transcription factor [Desulfobulbus sp.]